MMLYISNERQWRDSSLNGQHLFNETISYIFGILLLLNGIPGQNQQLIGIWMIVLFYSLIFTNSVYILIDGIFAIKKALIKLYIGLVRRRQQNIIKDAKKTVGSIMKAQLKGRQEVIKYDIDSMDSESAEEQDDELTGCLKNQYVGFRRH